MHPEGQGFESPRLHHYYPVWGMGVDSTSQSLVNLILLSACTRGGIGDYSGGDTPVPIPNTVVKLSSSDDTAGAALWETRTLPLPPRAQS